MVRTKISFGLAASLVCLPLLPLLGLAMAGGDLSKYLHFPPLTGYVKHAAFSWPVWVAICVAEVITVGVLAWALWRSWRRTGLRRGLSGRGVFPWWGWGGLGIGLASWVAAWTRLAWLAPIQLHTFIPLWFSYNLVINGLCLKRTRHSLLTDRPVAYLLLFPLSAVFWWFFEFLNRFVQNWHYVESAHYSRAEYIAFATVSFSTVLPAVLGTRQFLLTFPIFNRGLTSMPRIRLPHLRAMAGALLLLGALGLFFLGDFPSFLFPLLWVSPLLVIVSTKLLEGRPTFLDELEVGDWREVVVSPLAALLCGFFWELWNWKSLAGWEYSIPFVDRFDIFEMPILGYGGYLPFGLECTVVAGLVLGCCSRR